MDDFDHENLYITIYLASYSYVMPNKDSQGQEEVACMRVFCMAYATTKVSYLHEWQL